MTDTAPRSFASRAFRALNPRLARVEAELRHERERIDQLQSELSELRRDSLRVAELTDLIEGRLTPTTEKQ